jgi:4-amino-4-deoxy-L-arabinose transferase-like glycosyltransferase
MTEMPRFKLLDLLLACVVLFTAAGVRVAYVWFAADQGHASGPLQVQDPRPTLKGLPEGAVTVTGSQPNELDALAYQLKEKQAFRAQAPFANDVEPTAHTTPGYPGLLCLVEMLGEKANLDRDAMAASVRWFQCALGGLTALLYFFFARRAFRSVLVGFLAGILCALYPFWIINTAEMDDGVLTTFLLAFAITLGARAGQEGGALSSLLYGLALAGLALVRATMLPFTFAAELWFLLRCRSLPRGWLYALLAFLGFANGLGAWTVRNYQQLGDINPLVDSAYLHLWMGNNPDSKGGPQTDKEMIDVLAKTRDEDPKTTETNLANLPQKDRYNSLAKDVYKQARDDTASTLQRRLRSGLCFFFGANWFQGANPWAEERKSSREIPEWLDRSYPAILFGTLFSLLLLGVMGWRWSYAWRWESLPASLAVFWIPLPYILGHAESLHGPRLPLDGVLLCYAALALICLVPGLGGRLLRGPAANGDTDANR